MKAPINFDKVADIYDYYVNLDFDVPFFLKETEGYDREILELMCGTGRLSLPLLNVGHNLTCMDYSKGMLGVFRRKITGKGYKATLMEMDVTQLHFDRKFGFIMLPFHSLSEILSAEKQKAALHAIASYLETNGTFILTLQNPKTRLLQADGSLRILGQFPMGDHQKIVISYINQYNPQEKVVSGFQFYEVYDASNTMVEKRFLEIHFKPIDNSELRSMLKDTGLEITHVFGDYSYSPFNEETSNFMIYKMVKVGS